jgi:anion-transporting  ArsA/GET3 family ATPase
MRVLFVCGKGGAGKTAITAAMSHFYSSRGGALAITLDASQSFKKHLGITTLSPEPASIKPGLYTAVLDRHTILTDYISGFIALKPFKNRILNHPLYPSLSAILPGFREVLLIDKIYSYTSSRKSKNWKTIVVDMPSTGFITNLLEVTHKASQIIAYAPLLHRIKRNCDRLSDPAQTRLIVVTIPEETPVQESKEMILELQNRCSMVVDTLIVNRMETDVLSDQTVHWINQQSQAEFTGCLSMFNVSHDSLKQIAALEKQRLSLANKHLEKLKKWWGEPILIAPLIESSSSENISKILCRHIVEDNMRRLTPCEV